MSSRDEAVTLRYAFVTNRVLRALRPALAGEALDSRDRQSLELGEKLLSEMIQGTAWASGTSDFGYSSSSVPAARQALSTLDKLKLLKKSDYATLLAMLQQLHTTLRALTNGGVDATPREELELLHQFFSALCSAFSEESFSSSIGSGFGDSGPMLMVDAP